MKGKKQREVICFPLWCHLDLNQGHMDFQSIALPTELWHHFESGADFFDRFPLSLLLFRFAFGLQI